MLGFELSRLYFMLYHIGSFESGFALVFIRSVWHGFSMDLSATAYCMAPFILLLLFEHVIKKPLSIRWYQSILICELTLVFLITMIDAELYLHWGNRFNNQILVYTSHPKEMLLSAGSANWIKSLGMGAILLAAFTVLYKQIIKILKRPLAYSWQHAIVCVLCLMLNAIAIRGGLGVSTMSPSRAIYDTKSINNASALNAFWNALYYCFNDANTLYGNSFKLISSEQAAALTHKTCLAYSDTLTFCNYTKPNVLIIVLESFTASASAWFSGHNQLTPNLDAYGQSNLAFKQCYASGDRTDKGLVAINSGYPAQPLSSIIVFPDKVNQLNGLSKDLKQHGYSSAFIYGGDADFASMKSYCVMQGFNQIIDKTAFSKTDLNSKWGAHDGHLFDKTLQTIRTMPRPFYTMALTLSSHEPFDVPYTSKTLDKKSNEYAYKNALAYADFELGQFLKACENTSWYDSTLIVLVADHGHDIGVPNLEFFGKEKFHIPMVIGGGALQSAYRGKSIDAIVSQTIIPSLLLNAMHLPHKSYHWQTAIADPNGFAQFHYNNGFGLLNQKGFLSYYNENNTFAYKGDSTQLKDFVYKGRVFQQALIDDFIQK